MHIVRSSKFIQTLKEQIKFISLDSTKRALLFQDEIDKQITTNLVHMPYKCRKSIYFNDENIRDLIYKGYTVVYKIDETNALITIIGMKKYTNEL